MTEPNDVTTKYTAGVKLSAAMKTAAVVLLDQANSRIVKFETLPCSSGLNELSDWLTQNIVSGVSITAGVDSSQVRFLDIRIPAVPESQQLPLLRTQAEATLPLSADEMALAWQARQDGQGLLCKTAVIRQQFIQPLMNQSLAIQHIVPEATGLAAAWTHRREHTQPCIVLLRRENDFLAALIHRGHLQCSAAIDAEGANIHDGIATGLLLQDIQTELEAMQAQYQEKVPVFVLTENSSDTFLEHLCTQIQNSGWNCEMTLSQDLLSTDCSIDAIEAFGLALTAAAGGQPDYDFRQAEAMDRSEAHRTKPATWLYQAAAVTVLLLVLALGASYWSAKHEIKLLRKVMATENDTLTVQQVLTEQSYRETVARARPDIRDLFERIEKCKGSILLDTFEFEKGRPVKIKATAKSYDIAYEFQKKLEAENKNVITAARLLEPRMDQKSNKVSFTITFHYRNFSK